VYPTAGTYTVTVGYADDAGDPFTTQVTVPFVTEAARAAKARKK
jgi:hypothetical protein